jgi:hypothetical protein
MAVFNVRPNAEIFRMSNENIAPPESRNAKLRVGLIVDSVFASKYVYELVEWAQTQNHLLISHLIIQKADNTRNENIETTHSSSRKKGFLDLIRLRSFTLITKVENFRMRGDKQYENHLRLFNLKKIVLESITITPTTPKTGVGYQYSDEEIQKVRDLDLDVLIRCSSGILSGELLKSARFGVISFHHADNRVNRGGPPGFWEVYLKQDNTGFAIQQLTDMLDGGNALIRGRFPTRDYFLLNQAALYTKSNFYLKRLLNDLAIDRALPAAIDSQPYFNRLFTIPSLFEQLKYMSRIGFTIAFNAIGRLLVKRHYRWGVAYMIGDWKTLVMWRANKIQNPPNHCLADPFVISEGNREYCFVEDYDFRSSKGCICVYQLTGKSAERLGVALVEPFHLSFPYLFRFDSKIYMCPETSENKDIRIYECVNFPLEWKLSKVLMSNVSAVDTMIFERDGLWWLITNIDPTNTGGYGSELFIFYSDNPLGEEWHSHPQNPVVIDSARGRNAGILFDDKWIYRVSHKQGFGLYGRAFSINKITSLSTVGYSESELCSVEPKFFPNLIGCHHLHCNGNISVFDYLRYGRMEY